jgi:hypothetical protein
MSALCKSGMVEGQPGDSRDITGFLSGLSSPDKTFCYVIERTIILSPLLPVAAGGAE